MRKEELKVFYLYDQFFYLVDENPGLKKILGELNYKYSDEHVQTYIDKLISWYYVKYSDAFLDSFFNAEKETDTAILDIMSFDKFRERHGVFEEDLFDYLDKDGNKVILHKNLVIAAGWGLIYYRRSNPEYGYYRAMQLLNDFNAHFSWNLPVNIYNYVFERDYSLTNEEVQKLIEDKKKHQKSEKKKKRRLFRR